jgi:hypothetical protein
VSQTRSGKGEREASLSTPLVLGYFQAPPRLRSGQAPQGRLLRRCARSRDTGATFGCLRHDQGGGRLFSGLGILCHSLGVAGGALLAPASAGADSGSVGRGIGWRLTQGSERAVAALPCALHPGLQIFRPFGAAAVKGQALRQRSNGLASCKSGGAQRLGSPAGVIDSRPFWSCGREGTKACVSDRVGLRAASREEPSG